mmetsp:Transcript_73682/g.232708  ORF Transcript_73682/g.232708 Transcript_73682/m.232708 type:complete len:237 (+) Transcript_73682:259-969(+)
MVQQPGGQLVLGWFGRGLDSRGRRPRPALSSPAHLPAAGGGRSPRPPPRSDRAPVWARQDGDDRVAGTLGSSLPADGRLRGDLRDSPVLAGASSVADHLRDREVALGRREHGGWERGGRWAGPVLLGAHLPADAPGPEAVLLAVDGRAEGGRAEPALRGAHVGLRGRLQGGEPRGAHLPRAGDRRRDGGPQRGSRHQDVVRGWQLSGHVCLPEFCVEGAEGAPVPGVHQGAAGRVR